MSAKLINKGVALPYIPGSDVEKGTIVKIGSVIGVVNQKILANTQGSLLLGDYWSCSRKSGAVFTPGDRAYVDLVTQEITDDNTDDFVGIYISDNILSSDFVNIKFNEYFGVVGSGGGGTWGSITGDINDQTDLITLFDSLEDIEFTQPSASTSWTIVHGRTIAPNFAFFNNLKEREYPLEDHSVAGQVTLTFATAVVHTATLPGNGTSASIRNDSVITVLASAVNTASGVIDITTAKTVIISMDANLTSDITFVGTPTAGTPLRLIFVNGATAYTASLAAAKFKSSDTLAIPVPLLPVTPNREHSFDFIAGSLSGKFGLTGYVYGL